ncbi:16S rRNA (uracil(1498)-N(3))-methyltransferase [Thermoleptolyngbya sp. M55_K2018_002]|uniref:16S rRNA (uracil(1498)-N(3))-methyltransferase n=1 Tax=Thermoleptolyngbya sp. M55_K2018_002 TaxID=2747808 RepID=UPI001A07AF35|nr:16S rRNA (uracil(1498)-N(3))-methyltransferase [Thermoleptolyngbya sp. M55_K2018_002]HIK42561.1 16S rRNA (uracil(1498)-N(3))-methyltransferase [Thermoleptolyngbya sp. M55_K2018_002]
MSQFQRLTIAPDQISGSYIRLTPEQQHYLRRVLRLQAGDRLLAMDGLGQCWLVAVEPPDQMQILEEQIPIAPTELPRPVVLLIAMPKGQGMDDIVRQATELGAAQIVPILSDRTLLNPSPQKLDRWRRIAQEAAEQSERQFVPTIGDPQPWSDALTVWNAETCEAYLCEARGDRPHLLQKLLPTRGASPSTKPVAIAIGPEGGWTNAEIDGAIAAGYRVVSLGRRVLRAITAPAAALAILAAALEQDMPSSSSFF